MPWVQPLYLPAEEEEYLRRQFSFQEAKHPVIAASVGSISIELDKFIAYFTCRYNTRPSHYAGNPSALLPRLFLFLPASPPVVPA